MQIKGDRQLEELKSSVEIMSGKFDEYEKDEKGKEKINWWLKIWPGHSELVRVILKVNVDPS